jgi:hypothetical protein
MKSFIVPSYTFVTGASGVGSVDLSGIANFNKKYLVAIINQTAGVVIYATGSQSNRYTNVTGSVVTLFYDTSSMNAGDTLQVIYEEAFSRRTIGSYVENLALTTEIVFTAPSNAISAIVQADELNTSNIRVKQGGTSTSTSGIQMQGGRSEIFNSGSNISVCSESSSSKVYIQWFTQEL